MSLTNTLAQATFTSDGTVVTYDAGFPLFAGATVRVITYIDISQFEEFEGDAYTELTNGVDYTTSNDAVSVNVTLTTAEPEGNLIYIQRVPDFTQDIQLSPGPLPLSSMETYFDKLMMAVQYVRDESSKSVKMRIDSGYDLRLPALIANKAIKVNSTGDGLEFTDVNIDDAIASAETSATNAATSASSAETSATNAETSAINAATSEANALAYETKAQDWANENEDVPVEPGLFSSKHFSIKSQDSATSAALSEANALAYETKAEQWANENEDVEVEPGLYSGFHWSKKAEEIAAGALPDANDTTRGILETANPTEATERTATDKILTPFGLGENVVADSKDVTPGKLLTAATYGIGGAPLSYSDLNDAVIPGSHFLGSDSTLNNPGFGAGQSYVGYVVNFKLAGGDNRMVQYAWNITTPYKRKYRVKVTTWGAWIDDIGADGGIFTGNITAPAVYSNVSGTTLPNYPLVAIGRVASNGSLASSTNIASASRTGGGAFTVTLSNSKTGLVLVTVRNGLGSVNSVLVSGNSFTVNTYSTDGVQSDRDFCIAVISAGF